MELHGPLDLTGELICPRSWVGVVFSLFMEKRLCRVRLTFSAAECHADFVFRLQTKSHNLTIFHVDTTLLDFLLVGFLSGAFDHGGFDASNSGFGFAEDDDDDSPRTMSELARRAGEDPKIMWQKMNLVPYRHHDENRPPPLKDAVPIRGFDKQFSLSGDEDDDHFRDDVANRTNNILLRRNGNSTSNGWPPSKNAETSWRSKASP